MPTIDFASVKGLEPLPVGTYPATVIKAEETTSKKGNLMLNLQWKIEGGKFDGRIVFDSLVFAPQSLFRVKQALQGLGFPKHFNGNVGPQDVVGKSAVLTLDIEASTQVDDDGEPYPPRNRIKKVRPTVSAGKKK